MTYTQAGVSSFVGKESAKFKVRFFVERSVQKIPACSCKLLENRKMNLNKKTMKQPYSLNLLLSLFLVLFISCSKDLPEPEEPYTGTGYIKGSFGSEYLNYTEQAVTTGGEAWGNSYDPNVNGGNLHLSRDGTSPDQRHISIDIGNIDLENLPIPTVISKQQAPRNKEGYIASAGIGLYDPSSVPQGISHFGPEDSYNYMGSTYEGLTVRITSKKNDIIEGTFEGEIKTPTGLVKTVTDGEFRVKIIRKE